MKNRKTSYSLSKLNLKKHDLHQTSQHSFKTKRPRNPNHSEIELLQKPHQHSNYQAVINEYYGTDHQRLATYDNEMDIDKAAKKKVIEKLSHGIQYKMKRLIQNHQFDSDVNLHNIVLEESDVDQEFEDKIAENKYFLKEQRQKNHHTFQEQKINTETHSISDQKESKKTSLLKIGNQKRLHKNKTKSLLPTIGVSSSKILNLADLKYDKNRTKNNQSERRNLRPQPHLPNIYESPPDYLNDDLYPNRIQTKHSLAPKQSYEFKKDEKSSKRKFTEHLMKKPDKKFVELKLQSKIEELKHKIGQRTSAKDHTKSKILDKNNSTLPQKKRQSRYSSHSVFDNIQEFLSNPHENNSKSQRKFLKLYEKIDQSSNAFQKQKQALQKKIQLIETKISTFIEEKKSQIEIQNLEKLHRPTSTGSSPIGETDSQFGALEWRRLQKERVERSSFENELKYVKSLEEKGHSNLMKYIENKKMLNQLKMIKKTHEMLSKNMQKEDGSPGNEKYTSI